MTKSIFAKNFRGYLILITITIISLTALTVKTFEKWHLQKEEQDLRKISEVLKSYITHRIENRLSIPDYINKEGKALDIRITIIRPDGTVEADSASNPDTMENHGGRPEIVKAMKGEISSNIRFSTTIMSKMLYMARPLYNDDQLYGVLRLSLLVKDIDSIAADLKDKIIAPSIILLILAIIIVFFISRNISNPIKEIAGAARQVADGNYNTKVYIQDKGELGELAGNFNWMIEQQRTLFENLNNHREELRAIISSLNEGLLVVNKEGDVILSNRSFDKMTNCDDTIGKKYWEICRSTNLNSAISDSFKENRNITSEVEIGGYITIASLTLLLSRDRLVITFHDITERKRLEKIKKDFVVNVSHELKTPLTSIIGFAETLESDELSDEQKKYLEIIKRNTNRIIKIVQDLLLLSGMEERPEIMHYTQINMPDLIRNQIKLVEPAAETKGLNLRVDIDENIPEFRGDLSKIEDMILNLIDNSIKYTEQGEVNISLSGEESNLIFEVSDTGIGIPESHHNRIFERFYVIDAARSRERGGSGLGLSIVKHIVLLHKGEVDFTSLAGKGTTFTVKLPL